MQTRDNVTAVIDKVIAAIEAEELAKFDMNTWLSDKCICGTVACIGGFAEIITGQRQKMPEWPNTAEKLGLSEEDGDELFFAVSLAEDEDEIEYTLQDITAEHAIFALKYLREHGTVMPWVEVFYHFENGEKT